MNLRVGELGLNLKYAKTADTITLESRPSRKGDCLVEFSPALSLRAQVRGAESNGKAIPFHLQVNSVDQHATVRFPACAGPNTVVIHVSNDFGLSLQSALPALGATSAGLRVLSESWSAERDTLKVDVSGLTGRKYDLEVFNPGQIASISEADFVKGTASGAARGLRTIRIQFPSGETNAYIRRTVTFRFATAQHRH
jgi:hypothetical protein